MWRRALQHAANNSAAPPPAAEAVWRKTHADEGQPSLEDDYRPAIRLVRCFAENKYDDRKIAANCGFSAYDVTFNAVLARSVRDLSDMGASMNRKWEERGAADGFTCATPLAAGQLAALDAWYQALQQGLEGLWNEARQLYLGTTIPRPRPSPPPAPPQLLDTPSACGFYPLFAPPKDRAPPHATALVSAARSACGSVECVRSAVCAVCAQCVRSAGGRRPRCSV